MENTKVEVDPRVKNRATVNKQDGSLELFAVKREDAGTYSCKVKWKKDTSPLPRCIILEVDTSGIHAKGCHGAFDKNDQRAVVVQVTAKIDHKTVLPCGGLTEALEKDHSFDGLRWSYCLNGTLTWVAGMANDNSTVKVDIDQRVENRATLNKQDGSLELFGVELEDAGTYLCKVERENDASPFFYFVNLEVDTNVQPENGTGIKDKNFTIPGNETSISDKNGTITEPTDPSPQRNERISLGIGIAIAVVIVLGIGIIIIAFPLKIKRVLTRIICCFSQSQPAAKANDVELVSTSISVSQEQLGSGDEPAENSHTMAV